MRLSRTLTAGLALAAATATLAACTSSGTPGDDGTGDGPTHITFWNAYTASDRPMVEELVRRFNDSQDDAVVDMTIQPNDVLTDTLLPAYQAGQGPTIVTIDASLVPSYVEQGVFQPVDDFYDGQIDPAVLPKASLDATTYDGKQWGVPFGATPTMLYWNKTLFTEAGIDEPPTTLDEMADDAIALTDPSAGTYGIAIGDREGPSLWAVLIWANGGGIVSEDGSRATFGDPESIEAVDRWSGLMRDEGISPIGMNGVDADTLFGAGKAAMLVNGPWVSAGFEEAGIDYGIVPVPEGSVTQTSVAISTNVHLNADASAGEKEAAYAFLRFWNSEESQTYWSVNTGYPPNRSDIPVEDLAENPTAQAFAAETNSQFYLGGLKAFAQIDGDVVVPTIQRITNGQGTAAELMPEAAQQIDGLLD
ncbi:MAG TPA: ABC transporter substrate-binding protein [Friedmanniella sp.]